MRGAIWLVLLGSCSDRPGMPAGTIGRSHPRPGPMWLGMTQTVDQCQDLLRSIHASTQAVTVLQARSLPASTHL